AWHGVHRLRRWRHEGEPPFWRRASSAAGVILLRIVPVVAPIMFLYGMIAEAQALPERVDWMFYSTAQSIIIIFAVNALVTTVFAPRSPQWRLMPASDRAAARICGLVLTLAIVYGVTTLIYVITRLAQAPFALTVAVAFPSSLFLAGIVVAILLTPLNAQHPNGMPSLRWLTALRIPIWLTVAAIVVCALGGGAVVAQALHEAIHPQHQQIDKRARMEPVTISCCARKRIVSSSSGSVLETRASIIVFGLAYGAARLFQSWLDARILKPAGISGGVRDSIRIGVGYIGIVIAALAALSL